MTLEIHKHDNDITAKQDWEGNSVGKNTILNPQHPQKCQAWLSCTCGHNIGGWRQEDPKSFPISQHT